MEAANVAIASPAEIVGIHVMRTHRPNRRRPHDTAVLIVMRAAMIEICVETDLRGVTFPNKILPIQIRDDYFLVAIIERVQFGIGVLLAHVEYGQILLKTVIIAINKNAPAQIDIVKNET